MASTSRRTATPLNGAPVSETRLEVEPGRAVPAAPRLPGTARTVEQELFEAGYAFDFFQAVRLLERLEPERRPVGRDGPPAAEVVRFRAYQSLSFPPSAIYQIEPPAPSLPATTMTVTFMGLTGPNGILPRHYTELVIRLLRDAKEAEKRSLRDWLDLFNHRFISLFYRAWAKYRFYLAYERGEYAHPEPDLFTRCLFSLIGMGTPGLRQRLRISVLERDGAEERERVLTRVDDLALLYYSGLFAQRPRCTVGLEALLRDYFRVNVKIEQFRGQWLLLEPANQSQLGAAEGNSELGVNLVAGERIWDVQGKIRLRLGPLRYAEFMEFLPDRAATPLRKTFYLLAHLTRLYLGPELTFEVQLVLKADEVPESQLVDAEDACPRLGWNTWIRSQKLAHDAEDAVFDGENVVRLNEVSAPLSFPHA